MIEPSSSQNGSRGTVIEPSSSQNGSRGTVIEPSSSQNGSRGTVREPSSSQNGSRGAVIERPLRVDYDGVAHTFGDRGELQAAGDWSFDCDAMGNLVQASKPGLTVNYLIDPQNRRIGRDEGPDPLG
jgi:hypothetical protein